MKKELYEQAKERLRHLVVASVAYEIPTLDHIMGVDKMSDSDKVFYAAYKKYGNRNHTWQDFKAMFNGDIKRMQETVKHWRTWDEINKYSLRAFQQDQKVIELLDKYDLEFIDEDTISDYKTKYPDLVAAFEKSIDLDEKVYPNYCTFDAKIANIEREFEIENEKISDQDISARKKLAVKYINKIYDLIDLRNANFVTGERIEEYRDIILNNPKIFSFAKKFESLSLKEKIKFAQMILNESSKRHGTPYATVVQDDAPNGPHILHESQAGGYVAKWKIFLLHSNATPLRKLGLFLQFIAHEDAHRVDIHNSEFGMIGQQIMIWNSKNYFTDAYINERDYLKQPTELSSYYLDEITGNALSQTIQHR